MEMQKNDAYGVSSGSNDYQVPSSATTFGAMNT